MFYSCSLFPLSLNKDKHSASVFPVFLPTLRNISNVQIQYFLRAEKNYIRFEKQPSVQPGRNPKGLMNEKGSLD